MIPDIGPLITGLLWLALLSVPLAVWKAVEIIWWVATHVTVQWS